MTHTPIHVTYPSGEANTKATHTAGPWTIAPPWSGFSQITGPEGQLIFGLAAGSKDEKRSDEECAANAALIAAAPEMLEALKSLATIARALSDLCDATDYEPGIAAAEDVIARAEGNT